MAVLAQVTNESVDLSRPECKEGIQAPSYSLHQGDHAICVCSYFDLSSRVSRLLILTTNGSRTFKAEVHACLFLCGRTSAIQRQSITTDCEKIAERTEQVKG